MSDQNVRMLGPEEYSLEELRIALIRDTDDNWPFLGAAALLAGDEYWLRQERFFQFLRTGNIGDRTWVGVAWKELASALERNEVDAPEPERLAVLRIAVSLTGYGLVSLSDAVVNHAPQTMRAIIVGILAAGGWSDYEELAQWGPPEASDFLERFASIFSGLSVE